MVPRSFGVHGCSLPLLLGSHSRFANTLSMGASRIDRRAHDGCLLPERTFAPIPIAGISGLVLEKLGRKTTGVIPSYICEQLDFRNHRSDSFSSHLHHQKYHLRQLPEFWLSRGLVLELPGSAKGMFLGATWALQLDPGLISFGGRPVFPSYNRPCPRPLFHSCFRRVSICHWLLSRLERPLLVRKQIFRFLNCNFYSGTLSFHRPLRARPERAPNRDFRSRRCSCLDTVELRSHISMGHPSHTHAGSDFLARNRLQSGCGCPRACRGNTEALSHWTKTING